MSDDGVSFEETEQAEADPAAGGDIESEATAPSEDEQPARRYLEVDDPDSHYVRVKIDGEEREIPFSELQKGYSQEASYTQKSQALAERARNVDYAERLTQALSVDPQRTLEILASQYGLTVAQVQQQLAKDDNVEYDDPLERQIAQERQAREALEKRLEQREMDEHVGRAISAVQQRYNLSDDDLRAVVMTAQQMQVGPEALPMIWESMAFQRIQARVQAGRDREAQKQAEQQQREAAKQKAAGVVSTGTGATGTTTQVDVAGKNLTVREALDAAFQQLGIDS